jgi:hypothetical protein
VGHPLPYTFVPPGATTSRTAAEVVEAGRAQDPAVLHDGLLVKYAERRAVIEFFPTKEALVTPSGPPSAFYCWPYFDSLMIASAALPATTQLAEPATTASSSNQRNPKSSMHSGKSGLMMMYPGITAPGM